MTRPSYPPPKDADLRALAQREGPVLSLLVPVTAAVPDVAQNPVRHEHVVKHALERLRELSSDATVIERAKRDLAEFAEEGRSPDAAVATRAAFWSPDAGCQLFGLPSHEPETARVGSCAVVRPVIRALRRPGRYRVLRLSANQVELLEGGERGLEPLAAPELPASLEDALGGQKSEQALQLHSTASGGKHPTYHGQGGAAGERKVDLERFHQHVARGLEATLSDDGIPLVLAADAQHRPGLARALRREVGLLEKGLEGNAERLSLPELHERTWPLVVESAEAARKDEQEHQGKAAPVTRLSEIAANASMGRIRRLWIPDGVLVPARLDEDQGAAVEAWGDDDLIESLAVQVLRRGGEVRVLAETEDATGEDVRSLAAELW